MPTIELDSDLKIGNQPVKSAYKGTNLINFNVRNTLFTGGEQGAWYDPSDRATLFQDSAGTTPVTAVEQPVGLILDKSKGLVLGPELVTNGDFSNGTTGWTAYNAVISEVNGTLKVDDSSNLGVNSSAVQQLNLVSGRTYLLTFDVVSVSGTWSIGFATSATAAEITFPSSLVTKNTTGPQRFVFTYGGTRNFLFMEVDGAGIVFYDNISVRELPGNHAFQTTTTSRPVLSARYNLLESTEDFSGGYWQKLRSAVTEKTRVTATESNSNGFGFNRGGLTILAAASLQAVVRLERGSRDWAAVTIFDGSANGVRQWVNTATGQLGTLVVFGSGWSRGTASASVDGADVVLTVTVNTVGTNAAVVIYPATSGDGAVSCVLGDYGFIKQADLRLSIDSALPYQRVNTSTDYDADPAKFPVYLRFDGVDDWLQTNSIDFTATDKMTVFAGVRKLSDGGDGTLVELSVAADKNNGAFFLRASAGAFPNYQFLNRGTINASTTGVGFAAPTTNTLTTLADISGDSAILRVNGTQVASSTANQGTGNYGNYPLYIGRRGGTSLPFNGQLYSLIVRGVQTSTTQIAQTETWVNGKTKAY